jgi:hypothetical protein
MFDFQCINVTCPAHLQGSHRFSPHLRVPIRRAILHSDETFLSLSLKSRPHSEFILQHFMITMLSLVDPTSYSWAFFITCLSAVFYAYRLLTAKRPQFPPGPKGFPFIGNLLEMGGEHTELLFQEWAAKFGLYSILRC